MRPSETLEINMSQLETIPETIPFSSIVWELPHQPRERKVYNGIESLAESIAERGTETPIVLSPLASGGWLLEAGGRRYTALKALGVDTLYYGSVSEPGRPGFVVKNRITTTEDHTLTELLENLHRENLDWRDELRLIVRAWKSKKREANLAGAELYMATFGKMLGNYGHSDINAAVQVHDEVIANPELFKDCKSIMQAYAKMLSESKKALQAMLVEKTMEAPKSPQSNMVAAPMQFVSVNEVGGAEPEIIYGPKTIDLSSRFKLGNSLDWMHELVEVGHQFDHIICDPDFAVAEDVLNSNMANAGEGIAQKSITESLIDLRLFLEKAFILCRGYCIFWYDLDHHEKLQTWAKQIGFRVQRWPIIWHKTDYRSNASPQTNFCKNIEYAMVCAKPGSTLATVQMSSVIPLPTGTTAKEFGHPFAKPPALWQRIMSSVASPGQTVFDPFMGSGSSTIAALRNGLSPSGGELNPDHYNSALLNIQAEYKKTLGPDTLFQ